MNKFLQWGVACGLLGMLQTPWPARGQAPVTALPAPVFIPVQVQIAPGTADAVIAELHGGFTGVINPGPVTAGMLGAPGLATRTGTVGAEIARAPVSSDVAGGPGISGIGLSAPGYFTSTPANPGTFGVPETAANAFEPSGVVPSQEVTGPTITNNGGDTALTLGSFVIPARPPTSAGINTGFGTRAINAGFGTRAINTGFGTQSINTGFGTRSINLGFGPVPGTPYGTQGPTGSAGRPPQ